MDEETDKERDERLNKLWNTLDSGGDGQIDVKGLKRGLKKMDHRKKLDGHEKKRKLNHLQLSRMPMRSFTTS